MEIVRAATLDDTDSLHELIQRASYGLTSLNLSREQLLERLEWSHFAFTRKTERPGGEPYVLVMEDLTAGRLVGTSCVFAKTGGYQPLYAFQQVVERKHCDELSIEKDVRSLQLRRVHDGPTEIGSLFLMPEYRGKGRGRLLSMSRFALIKQRPNRFANEVIAEMRGVSDDHGISPVWEAIGKHFFGISFPEADAQSTVSKKFIADLVPEHPIYWDLLPLAAQDSIGKVHRHTEPAFAMLKQEGFEQHGFVDIFDGGPALHCERDKIRSVKQCREAIFAETSDALPEGEMQIVASDATSFRAANMSIEWIDDSSVAIPAASALAINAKLGDRLWILPSHINPEAT